MPHDEAIAPSAPIGPALGLAGNWRGPLLALALAGAGLFALFADAWAQMAHQWWNISTYSHVLLVPAIIGWLVWQRWDELAKLDPHGWWPGLFFMAGALFLGLLGTISGLNLARHLAAVLALQAGVVTLLGPRVAAGLVFPLAYMFFLVPMGDELVPALQIITAKITIWLTNVSSITAQIDGVFIDTPAGLFEVAEACSGVKFLVAMIALGSLVAHVCFQSWQRRAAFMAAAFIIPVLANGVRAWGTIYIAQFAGVEFAAGVDHIIYGWIFFAIVMALLLALGWKFFDRDADAPFIQAQTISDNRLLGRLGRWQMKIWTAFLAIVMLGMVFAGWAARASTLEAPLPNAIDLAPVKGWVRTDYTPQVWWEPRASGAGHRLLGRYADGQGRRVDVFVALYAAQDELRDAAAYGQGALMAETDWRWLEPGQPLPDAATERLLARGHAGRFAATFYRSGDVITGSRARLKLANMFDRLMMRDHPTMMVILSAEETPQSADGAKSVEAFLGATGPMAKWMDHMAKGV